MLGLVRLILKVLEFTLQFGNNLLELLAFGLHSVGVVLLSKGLAVLLFPRQIDFLLEITLLLEMGGQGHVLCLDLRR